MRQSAIAFNWHVPGNPFPIGAVGAAADAPITKQYSGELPDRAATHKAVRRMLKARRARADFFDSDLFADPAWDILLELYATELAQRRMSVSNVCDASDVPATTALRWIKALEDRCLLQRRQDPHDGRRTFIELTKQASRLMESFLQRVPAAHI